LQHGDEDSWIHDDTALLCYPIAVAGVGWQSSSCLRNFTANKAVKEQTVIVWRVFIIQAAVACFERAALNSVKNGSQITLATCGRYDTQKRALYRHMKLMSWDK